MPSYFSTIKSPCGSSIFIPSGRYSTTQIADMLHIPSEYLHFSPTPNSDNIILIKPLSTLFCHIRLLGGKGGFGNLLKTQKTSSRVQNMSKSACVTSTGQSVSDLEKIRLLQSYIQKQRSSIQLHSKNSLVSPEIIEKKVAKQIKTQKASIHLEIEDPSSKIAEAVLSSIQDKLGPKESAQNSTSNSTSKNDSVTDTLPVPSSSKDSEIISTDPDILLDSLYE